MSNHDDERDDEPSEHQEHGRFRTRLENLIPNIVRRTMAGGAGARQVTEDAIRGAIGDIKLPKETVNTIVDFADHTKREVVRVAAREFREFLESARFNEELAKILTQLSFEIRTEIRFVPNDKALKPLVSTQTRLKNTRGEDTGENELPTDGLSDVFQTGATEFAEHLLGRIFKEAQRGQDAAADPVEPDGRRSGDDGRSSEKPQSDKASSTVAANSAAAPERSTSAPPVDEATKPASKEPTRAASSRATRSSAGAATSKTTGASSRASSSAKPSTRRSRKKKPSDD